MPSEPTAAARPPGAPRLSVVIPVRDSRDDLARCLESLKRQSVSADEFEILVVDDGSSDGTPEVAAEKGARVIRQNRRGASAARNRGAREAWGEIVLYLDADCVADANWAGAISRPLVEDASLAGVVGRYESDQESSVARFVQLDLESRYVRMSGHDRIDFLNSGNCALRRELLVHYPFDETFQRLEDVELSFRLARDGHVMVFAPDARAWHRHPERVLTLMRRKFNYARYAFPLYRQYPNKAAADASTPPARRARLVFLALFLVALALSWVHPAFPVLALVLAALAVATSSGLVRRAFAISPGFGFASVAYLLLGNLAFLAGAARGLLAGKAPEAN